MAGVKGMIQHNRRHSPFHAKAWASMRILRRFTIPDLLRTIPDGDSEKNLDRLQRWMTLLARHGYVAGDSAGGKLWRKLGEYQVWRLLRDIGPTPPVTCEECGNSIFKPHVQRVTIPQLIDISDPSAVQERESEGQ